LAVAAAAARKSKTASVAAAAGAAAVKGRWAAGVAWEVAGCRAARAAAGRRVDGSRCAEYRGARGHGSKRRSCPIDMPTPAGRAAHRRSVCRRWLHRSACSPAQQTAPYTSGQSRSVHTTAVCDGCVRALRTAGRTEWAGGGGALCELGGGQLTANPSSSITCPAAPVRTSPNLHGLSCASAPLPNLIVSVRTSTDGAAPTRGAAVALEAVGATEPSSKTWGSMRPCVSLISEPPAISNVSIGRSLPPSRPVGTVMASTGARDEVVRGGRGDSEDTGDTGSEWRDHTQQRALHMLPHTHTHRPGYRERRRSMGEG
jgi:hypothetical protein